MDIFQLVGDFLHLIAVLMLLLKILANKNVIGITFVSQDYLIALKRYSLQFSLPGMSTYSWGGKLSMSS